MRANKASQRDQKLPFRSGFSAPAGGVRRIDESIESAIPRKNKQCPP